MALLSELAWLFPEHDAAQLDVQRDRRLILGRVLEQGRMSDVRWCVKQYGLDGIHDFFRYDAHPEISDRTRALWRGVLNAREEKWQKSRRSRLSNSAPWPG